MEKERAAAYIGHPAGPDGLVEKGASPLELAEALEGIVVYNRSRTNARGGPHAYGAL